MTSDRVGPHSIARVIARTNVGGPSLQITALMRGLDSTRYSQVLYRGSVDEGEADYLELRAPDVAATTVPGLGRSVKPLDDIRALWFLIRRFRETRPLIVHTHTAKAGVLGRVAAVVARVPIRVHTFHGHVLNGYFSPWKTRLVIVIERVLGVATTFTVAVGDQVLDDLIAVKIASAGRSGVVAPGVRQLRRVERASALTRLGLPNDDRLIVMFVGRLTAIKRAERYVEVARTVLGAGVAARFVVVGDGPERAALEDVGRDLVELRFIGWQSDMAAVYSVADLLVLTSDNEGMPVALIEAAMQGVPAVATDVGAVGQVVVDGETGVLVDVDDSAGLAEAVTRLLVDAALRRSMGLSAEAHAHGLFGEHRLVSDYAAIYDRLIAEFTTRRRRHRE